jgi:hypothetical protein
MVDLVGIEPSRGLAVRKLLNLLWTNFQLCHFSRNTYTILTQSIVLEPSKYITLRAPGELLMAKSYRVLLPVRFAVECPLVALALQPGRAEAQESARRNCDLRQ